VQDRPARSCTRASRAATTTSTPCCRCKACIRSSESRFAADGAAHDRKSDPPGDKRGFSRPSIRVIVGFHDRSPLVPPGLRSQRASNARFVTLLTKSTFAAWRKKAPAARRRFAEQAGFTGAPATSRCCRRTTARSPARSPASAATGGRMTCGPWPGSRSACRSAPTRSIPSRRLRPRRAPRSAGASAATPSRAIARPAAGPPSW
jgi:hypothetical protein